MGPWTLLYVVFLTVLCSTDGQFVPSRRYFCFSSIGSFWELHELQTPKVTVLSSPRFTLLAPDLLRTDSPENIYLRADGVSGPVTASISIQDFSKTTTLLQDSVTLTLDGGFHALKAIQLPSDHLNREELRDKFVYLKVDFGDFHSEERVMMVSFHSGYIFIQTDKPIYKPGDTVRFRVFASSLSFKAFDLSITIDMRDTDGMVVKQFSRIRPVDGVFADTLSLSEFVNEGKWLVTAKFDDRQENTFTSEFEVKKYVLPAFNVTLTPRKSFLNLDDSELEVEVTARYLYGEPVQGTAYVVFGVKINQEMRRFPSVKQVSNLDGGVVSLSMEEIRRVYPNVRSLVGKSVYVKVSVLTSSGSDLVEAEKTGIKIVSSPYVVSFKDIPKYFKPGLPLDFTIQVRYHDGPPAQNVLVTLKLLNTDVVVSTSAGRVSINMPADSNPQTIAAETTQADLRAEQQAKRQVTVRPYVPFNPDKQNYLYISTSTNVVSLGNQLSLKLTVAPSDPTHRELITHITYLVLSKGKIIAAERVDVADQLVTAVVLTVTPEMMPSFRFVAFYSIPWKVREEVVSDSIWVDVADSCVGGLKVGPVDRSHRDYTPGVNFSFQVRGDPGAKVSLVAVDNAVYLLNRDRLTQRKIWGAVEHGDIGCTRGGGGGDAKSVFSDAGLLYASSAGFQTQTRQALQCQRSARGRRSAEMLQRKAQLESHYKQKLQQRCCVDGLREIPMPYSCTRRSLYITEGWECIRAFRYCCATFRNQAFDAEPPTKPPLMDCTRTAAFIFQETLKEVKVKKEEEDDEEDEEDEEDEYLDETQVYLRSKFHESWLWMDVNLPDKTDRDGLAVNNVDHALPDSITEWGILAVSASPHTGFCVAEPYNVKAWKRFFVDLKLPYSVARNEQVQIKAVVHNYFYEDLRVRVMLMKTEDMCSIAFKRKNTQEVMVPAGSSVTVPYTIMPLVVGKLPLEVMVVSRGMGGDRVQKQLRVVLEGVQKTKVWSTVLKPSAHRGIQTVRVGKQELESVVPNSVPETFINVRGNVLADSIDNSITEDSLATLIRMPGGCVEQNLALITLPLIATLYLERTNNWESVGVERKAEALRYIKRGYEKQLEYRKPGGSYPPYRREGASTWITAYVVKVFSMAYSIIAINQQDVCSPLNYLLSMQLRTGNFEESNPVYSTTMTGGLRGDDPETTLTAFVLIALAEAKRTGISCIQPYVEVVIRKTADCLTRALVMTGRRPYTVAIASYALALLGKAQPYDPTPSLLRAAAPGGSHWPDTQNPLFSLEATGYALLALVQLGRMEEAAAPFKWLNGQRRRGGGFGSTQSTMVVLQALSQYLINKPPPDDVSLNVDVRTAGRSDLRYHFNLQTAYVARSSRLPANADLEVVARGNGQGILEVVTYYNQLHEAEEKKSCKDFELNVTMEESREKPPADVVKSYQITIKVRALGPSDVRMVVLDISLPTGFTPEYSDLEKLSNSVDGYISNFQVVDNLSDRGSLIIHLFKVSNVEQEILIFRLQQSFRVGLLQPSSVTVYEYYHADHRCSHSFSPPEDREELTQICRGHVCRCTQGDCCVSRSDAEDVPDKERETFACRSLHHVFQVKVLNVSQSYYDKYEMEITRVIKLGVEAGVKDGQRRFFMSHGGCRGGLVLLQGSQYLVMGPKEDQWTVDADRFMYMLGKDSWVERWPSPADCSSSPVLQAKCRSLQDAVQELSVNACRL
ncbi:complement C3-like [Clinocottus analis]|uniref:complement C3-like n=1 Tax=Clinocottus analis TaxID=304258 RepID=UPI0035BFF643